MFTYVFGGMFLDFVGNFLDGVRGCGRNRRMGPAVAAPRRRPDAYGDAGGQGQREEPESALSAPYRSRDSLCRRAQPGTLSSQIERLSLVETAVYRGQKASESPGKDRARQPNGSALH